MAGEDQEDVAVIEDVITEPAVPATPREQRVGSTGDLPLTFKLQSSCTLQEAWPISLLDEGDLKDGGKNLVVFTIDVHHLDGEIVECLYPIMLAVRFLGHGATRERLPDRHF